MGNVGSEATDSGAVASSNWFGGNGVFVLDQHRPGRHFALKAIITAPVVIARQ
jgi:hypothetical protein